LDDISILGCEDYRHGVNRFVAHYDAPAYVRRARRVEDALDSLVGQCRRRREEWLNLVRIRLGQLHALASDWTFLAPLVADADQVLVLKDLHAELKPRLRVPVNSTSSVRVLRRALGELRDSIERFNHRWQEFLRKVDLTPVNEARDGYNRYYVLEKECAVRSPRLARQGFRRLEPMTLDELTALVPPLRVPQLAE
jgi:hypothetical protein